jgi:hypothetical protein
MRKNIDYTNKIYYKYEEIREDFLHYREIQINYIIA